MLTGLFIAFDIMVGKHQKKMLDATKQSDAIVRSLFPDAVADRLYEDARKKDLERAQHMVSGSKNAQLRNFMKSPTLIADSNNNDNRAESAPIAELFTDTTIMFADFVGKFSVAINHSSEFTSYIASALGFTAWCSEREPAQVFTLLETVYSAMDKIARRMHVFKVETIGDCYVAATGLPEPQKDHAERMSLFAYKCLNKVKELTKKLESKLGPGTADLSMRIGIHSGPVRLRISLQIYVNNHELNSFPFLLTLSFT
jgi:Adenylate and Guanylate cyclase catalytic domain